MRPFPTFAKYGSALALCLMFLSVALPAFAGFLWARMGIFDPFPDTSSFQDIFTWADSAVTSPWFWIGIACIAVSLWLPYGRRPWIISSPNGPQDAVQMLLEVFWSQFRDRMILNGRWGEDLQFRFSVFQPLRKWYIGGGYLVPMHFWDTRQERNSSSFSSVIGKNESLVGLVYQDGIARARDLGPSTQPGESGLELHATVPTLEKSDKKSEICIPLKHGNRIVGVLAIESGSPMSETRFDKPEIYEEFFALAQAVIAACRTAYRYDGILQRKVSE